MPAAVTRFLEIHALPSAELRKRIAGLAEAVGKIPVRPNTSQEKLLYAYLVAKYLAAVGRPSHYAFWTLASLRKYVYERLGVASLRVGRTMKKKDWVQLAMVVDIEHGELDDGTGLRVRPSAASAQDIADLKNFFEIHFSRCKGEA